MTAYSLHPGIINTELGRYMMDHMQAEADAQGWLAQQLSKAFASFWCARACVCVRACTHVLVCVYVCAHERVCVCVCVRVGICYIPLLLPHTFSGHGGYEQALVLLRFAGRRSHAAPTCHRSCLHHTQWSVLPTLSHSLTLSVCLSRSRSRSRSRCRARSRALPASRLRARSVG